MSRETKRVGARRLVLGTLLTLTLTLRGRFWVRLLTLTLTLRGRFGVRLLTLTLTLRGRFGVRQTVGLAHWAWRLAALP